MLKTKSMPWLPWWPPVDGGEVKQTKKFSVVAVALLLGLAGCGTTPKLEGADIPNAKEFLEKADAEFKEAVGKAEADTLAVAEDGKCFFEDTGNGEIGEYLYCGPAKSFGGSESWFRMGFGTTTVANGTQLRDPYKSGHGDPSGKLFRPDNASPGDPGKLEAPLGPMTDQKEFAVLIPADSVSAMTFADLETPAVLKEPAGTLTVTAKADAQVIPSAAMAALGSTSDTNYRPAEGQSLGVWKVEVSGAEDIAPEFQSAGLSTNVSQPRDATAALTVEAGQTQLTLKDGSNKFSDGKGGASFRCAHVKCGEVKTSQYLLVVSTASLDGAQLVATTDGQAEKAPLAGGATQADHSLMLYQGGKTKADVSTTWGAKEFVSITPEEMPDAFDKNTSVKSSYDGRVTAAYLTPFESTLGWAPSGQAWLVLSLENIKFETQGLFSNTKVDWAATWKVTSGDSAVEIVDTGYRDRAVFKVPQEAKDFQVSFQPKLIIDHAYTTGKGSLPHVTKEATAPEAETVDVKFS